MTDPGGNSERRRVIAGLVAGLLHLAGCGGGGSGHNGATAPQPPSPPPPPPPPAPIDVSVTPSAASVHTRCTQTFTATVTNTANRAVIWQVNGVAGGNTSVGTISTTGVYTAPATVPSPAIVTVTAVSVADPTRSGSAQVTVTAAPTPVTVSVAPAAASVQTGGTQTFTATVTNTTNTAVTWQVNGITGGNTSVGTISTTGVYTAPATVPSPAMVTVTAVSVADPTRSGAAQVTVTAPPPSTSWLWGVTTDDSTVQTASQVSAVAAFSKRVTIRAVFDPPVSGLPAATNYLSSVQALSATADVMGLLVASSAMSQITTADVSARVAQYLSCLGPYRRVRRH